MSTEEEIEKLNGRIEKYREAGRQKEVEMYEDQVVLLERKLKKEKEKIKPHPALQFGPISQTVALMACLSLGISVAPLPPEAIAFYTLFSRLTIVAVMCLVVHSSIIWYGYNEAIKKLPKPESLDAKLAKMMKSRPDRADLWAHTRSHPSLFLTTRAAAPRLFPFPLGKTKVDATIRDELWWEGGNAPDVGHFNKPKLPEPTGPDEETLMARFKESLTLESQQKLWKKRIRTIQYLCTVIIVSFINRKIAIAGLCWLIYNTFSTELDNMLKPPDDLEPVYKKIDGIVRAAGKTESAPKPGPDQPAGGMSYIYDPISARQVKPNANIPITVVPPHVLVTSENHYYAGPGEQIKDPDK